MGDLRAVISWAMLLVVFMVVFPAVFVHADGSHASGAIPDNGGWACKNLKQDWNYLFHPERVNQCQPHGLVSDNRLEGLSKKAFTGDDPLIPRYCGSPFRE